jgi:hypothetical protein
MVAFGATNSIRKSSDAESDSPAQVDSEAPSQHRSNCGWSGSWGCGGNQILHVKFLLQWMAARMGGVSLFCYQVFTGAETSFRHDANRLLVCVERVRLQGQSAAAVTVGRVARCLDLLAAHIAALSIGGSEEFDTDATARRLFDRICESMEEDLVKAAEPASGPAVASSALIISATSTPTVGVSLTAAAAALHRDTLQPALSFLTLPDLSLSLAMRASKAWQRAVAQMRSIQARFDLDDFNLSSVLQSPLRRHIGETNFAAAPDRLRLHLATAAPALPHALCLVSPASVRRVGYFARRPLSSSVFLHSHPLGDLPSLALSATPPDARGAVTVRANAVGARIAGGRRAEPHRAAAGGHLAEERTIHEAAPTSRHSGRSGAARRRLQ